MPLPDPGPLEPEPPVSGNGQPARHDRLHPTRLSPTEVAFLHQSLARQERRRLAYRGGLLRVRMNGAERWQVDPRGSGGEPFRVPLGASVVEIVGDDAEGALVLAVFPLPDPDLVAGEGVQHLSVTLEGGQMIALTMALDGGGHGQAHTYVIHLAYADPSAVTVLAAGRYPEASIPPQEGDVPTP